MNNNIIKILQFIGISIIFLFIGIFIGKNNNCNFESQEEKNDKIEKISISTIIVSTNREDTSITASDIIMDDKMFFTYKEIINSNVIRNKVKQKYPNAKDIELEKIENTEILKVIYNCNNVEEKECIDINNYYISIFLDNITKIYSVDVSIIANATISTRIIN